MCWPLSRGGKAGNRERRYGGIRQETGARKDKALPVLYCSEMIDQPSVRAAIQDAALQLKQAYRK